MAVPEEIQEQVLKEATSATPNYNIDYNDERFANVETDKQQAMTDLNNTYGGMIENTDNYFDAQIQASKDWADKQAQIQQENTDFTIEKIEQEKDQANKDYLKEQSGAFVDWQKQSNKYGTEAEKMASAGLANTGFSESSQVSMYNTYQNRVATARESYNKAVLNYNNAIKDAQLQNNAALAEIAFSALQQQLELSLQGFQYKNQLILEQANKKVELDNIYYNRYQDILNQINTENALKEDIRQFESNQAFQEEQAALDRTFQAEQNKIKMDFEAKEAELTRKHDKEMLAAKTKAEKELLEEQHKKDMEKLKKQQEYEMAQLDKKHAQDKALAAYTKSLSGGGTGGGSKISGGSTGGGTKVKNNSNTGGSGSKVNNTSNTNGNFKYPIDNASVLALGYGPISAGWLADLVNKGEVVAYVENGKTKFYKKKKPGTVTREKAFGSTIGSYVGGSIFNLK